MQGFNEEIYTPENIRSGVNIQIKVADVDLKAGEGTNVMQPVYYNSTNKEFTTESENGDLYGFSAISVEADSSSTSVTKIPLYLTGEFYKDSVVLVNEEDIEELTIKARKLGIFLE